jgi:uncharacterized protein YndB with AHSA1/START domain
MHVENGNELVTKNQTIERRSDRELVVTRTFNAPARIVFDAWTKPELVMRWWAPRSSGMKLLACEIDLRVGGKYRYVFAGEGDTQLAFFGTYKEVERPTRLVSTDEDQTPTGGDGEAFTTTTFTEKAGKTAVVMLQLYASKEALDEAVNGMDAGTRETFDQLEELLAATNKSGG